MAELTEELRVLVTAEVEKAVSNLKKVDAQTKQTEKMFKSLGAAIGTTFSAAAILKFAKDSDAAYRQHNQTVNVLNSTLKATGATAWTTSQELQKMAKELQSANYTADSINKMQSVLLGFKNISGDTFRETTKAILDMAKVMDMDLSSAAQSIGKALDDPIHGMDSLKKQGFNFTAAQKKVIQSLLDTGETAKAQKIILDELNGTFGGAAEAAADSATQIKNAWGDVKEATAEGLSYMLKAFAGKMKNNPIAEYLEGVAGAFKKAGKEVLRDSGNYSEWWDSLSNTERLAEAEEQIQKYTDAVALAEKNMSKARIKAERELVENNKKYNEQKLKQWEEVKKITEQIVQEEQEAVTETNRQAEAVSKIDDLMLEISQNYEKLSKNDPVIQLESYRQELEEIAKNRETLTAASPEIDTSKAMEQLDYLEKEIKKKMLSISVNGKQTWQKYLSDMLNVELGTFDTGAEAVEQFIAGMESETAGVEKVSELLGKGIDLKPTLLKQKEEIREILISMFSIDPAKIDESFESADGSVQKLIDKYKSLPSDFELTEFDNLADKLGALTEQGLNCLDLWDEKTNKVVGSMVSSLAQLSFDATLSGFKELGQALGEGEDAADSMQRALETMASEILNQLPLLFMQAGLQLITQNQWPLGLGLLAAGLGDAVIAGYVNGKTQSTKSNALGGVYGDEAYTAFAKGGTFTNQIVAKPTYFRFAKGSGFGTGLMGEAGPEAIMPLTRGADGSLGVSASGIGGGDVQVNIPVTVYSDEPVEVHDTEDENGQRKIEILVGSMINQHIAGGKADKALRSRYGLKVQGV